MASAAIKALRQSLPQRSIRISVYPTPVTFAERRSVLQALQQFGSIEYFQMTPGHHSNYVSITKDVATAQELITRSPLSYRISTSQPDGRVSIDGSESQKPEQDRADNAGLDREFKLQINPEPDYYHESAQARSAVSQPWPATYRKERSFMTTALKNSLPPSVSAEGLAHWLINFDGHSGDSHKTMRLVSKGWLPSAIARGPAGDGEDAEQDAAYEEGGRGRAKLARRGYSAERKDRKRGGLGAMGGRYVPKHQRQSHE